MKDEIKEILDRLERIDHKEYSGGFEFADSSTFNEMARCFEERKKMADYITNLEQENERIARAINYNIKIEEKYCHAAFFDDELSSVAYKIAEDNIKMLLYGGKVDNE